MREEDKAIFIEEYLELCRKYDCCLVCVDLDYINHFEVCSFSNKDTDYNYGGQYERCIRRIV